MSESLLDRMRGALARVQSVHRAGRVDSVSGGVVQFVAPGTITRVGDRATVHAANNKVVGEVIRLDAYRGHILIEGPADGISTGDYLTLHGPKDFSPGDHWIGRVIDPDGQALDGRPILPGTTPVNLHAPPPPAQFRKPLGARLETGHAVFNTLLPLVRGQRVGLFAGSGVGKSSLIAGLATGVDADVIVIALVGERGREVRDFVHNVLGDDGMRKSVVVAATSDRAPQVRRRCALAATAVAEHFRDQGKHVLLLIDSVTRYCEAHREIAVSQGEAANLRGFPASTASVIAGLCERAGPGCADDGDITAIFSVLVAGSDMEEPVADMLRGVLDGHITLDRDIAQRGRFPAVDVVRSTSRSLPHAANTQENSMIQNARRALAAYDSAALMIQSGLYEVGSDAELDAAIRCHAALDEFLTIKDDRGTLAHFAKLRQALTSSPMQSADPV